MNLSSSVLGFLYFPEDKSLYGPAAIEFVIMLILCTIVFIVFRKVAKKQALKTKELEERILRERQNQSEDKHSI